MLERPTAPALMAGNALTGLRRRRALFALLAAGTMAGLLGLAAMVVPPRNAGAIAFLVLFAMPLPWLVVGFWNAAIGLLLMLFCRDPVAAVNPLTTQTADHAPVTASTAILMCVRNEDPEKVIRNLNPLLDGLAQTDVSHLFHVYVLSDTSHSEVAAAEESCFGAFSARWRETFAITYRRRAVNAGFKAGNIRDFCEHWGGNHEYAVVLDADSFLPAETVLRLQRIMQANPALGILQTLIVGLPSSSAFARIFQFGMRLGMRSYTLGAAWWQGDCGPYWGHNAILRLKPFIAYCRLPVLPQSGPLGGYILSHDQVEAALMRRAGYEVRVVPEEGISWEDNPPTLLEFVRRDLRWCQGNMQYWRLLGLPGLKPVSRFQILFAILMYLGSPAWMALIGMGTAAIALSEPPSAASAPPGPGLGGVLFGLIMLMIFAPKIASIIEILSRPRARQSYGGAALFALSIICETMFTFLLSAIMAFIHTVFLLRLLLLRRGVVWNSQARESHAVPWSAAWRALWLPTLAGLSVLGIAAAAAPHKAGFAFLAVAGLVLCVPFAVATASPYVGALLMRIGIGRIPEETAPPRVLLSLHVTAVEKNGPDRYNSSNSLFDSIRAVRGVIRSLRLYYGDRLHAPAMQQLYRPFIGAGDLVFDIGAHVGDRVAVFRRLDARVVAVEPQPALAKTLWLLYGRDPKVIIEATAVGRTSGIIELNLNLDNPTVSTASKDLIAAAGNARGWEGQTWDKRMPVPLTTLDALIARHGTPAFIKIDVEGFEAEVLAGLDKPIKALSFEFTTIQRDVALACIKRCMAMGYIRFNASLGESQTFVHNEWIGGDAIARWLADLPHEANSGDVYARLA